MAVLKQTSPTAWPGAPTPNPSITVPSASTRRAVGTGSVQPESPCFGFIKRLDSAHARPASKPISSVVDISTLIVWDSLLTCPSCGHEALVRMPDDACRIYYDCKGCGG